VAAFVLPQFVPQTDHLSFVKYEYNGVVIESGFADKQFFYGKGAGSFPTASAVLSDISALRYDYHYEYKKRYQNTPAILATDFHLRVYVSFDEWTIIPKDDFNWIEEWHADQARKYLVGVIHASKLRSSNWWKENNTSLILAADPIIENLDEREIKKKSLALAGIF
jgi:homoserine dehydrogenase